MAKAAGVLAGVSRVKPGAYLAPRPPEPFPRKRSWSWILAGIAVVCRLCSLGLQASLNPASSFEKHGMAWPRESRSPSSCQSLRVLSGGLLGSRAGPQEFFFTSDVLLRAEDLDPVGPPWLESRGPPSRYRDLGRPVGLGRESPDGPLLARGKLRFHPEFSGGRPPAFKKWRFSTGFS